ncbi:GNAT family N-acetyltransferase (plasmid) [Rhizobium grahamii]|uniref:GNAT family N-acetyltransferase n=1 Tax=Rhizobium grahamii TaxID=1120045 RepID=A0A5Q0CHD5_9HYPH|nr:MULTISPECIES: GNAT family N-acetyltransferase [Rhizobium]QFY63579.1 GNAT family N-acetyltransferase [Rhizobium grahamii]QRM51657.1 GNAT family N-acetyltransferase [Rhizobium sp. BG6]
MISIAPARTEEDFETCASFCRALGELDVAQGKAFGVPADLIIGLYHGQTGDSLAEKFGSANASMLIANWNGTAAGCIGLAAFDTEAGEIHKFYVDPAFRGRRIGHALMTAALEVISRAAHRKALVHTAIYMTQAVTLYEAFAFRRCEPFRPVPEAIRHTEIFFCRSI